MQSAGLAAAVRDNILVLDGAMGTMIQQANLSEADFGGAQYDGCNEYLTMTRPDVILEIHRAYVEAGADIIETNTFGATSIVLAEYDLAPLARQLNRVAAELARQAADAYATAEWPRFVAGAMGPTTKNLSVTGGVTFAELQAAYEEQACGLIEGGVDALLVETAQDMLNVKAASLGIEAAFAKLGKRLPILISGTIEPMGTTLGGQTIDAFYVAVEHLKPLSVGLNCATGPEFMRDHMRTLAGLCTSAVSCYPNAGLPDEDGHYHETPASFATKVAQFADQGWLNIVGGCCGTTPDHIRAVRAAVQGKAPRAFVTAHAPAVSGLEAVFLEPDNRPLFIGERTNVTGSRKFKKLITAENYESAAEVARAQVKAGAHVIDINLADPDRDERVDMEAFMRRVVRKVKIPLMIDSTDPLVVELGLKHSQGKAIINSANLEEGEGRLAAYAQLATKYGAALVVTCIDEQGQPVTRDGKLQVAVRCHDLLVHKYGLPPQDIIFDALTFPCATGDKNYLGSALETVEAIRLIKARLPGCSTILGVSNISFGLPPAGREVLNSVFLYHCTKAGLDYAIVNTEKLERFASIPEAERRLSEQLLFETTDEILAEFTATYREQKSIQRPAAEHLTVEERLGRCIIEGSKEGLIRDLDALLQTTAPLDIINGPLMEGMSEVGRLFNNNELIVAEVLQSAEVMKAAVGHLEQFMEKTESANKGKMLLATVKGDVHDIGKNLVEIILTNNGYEIINLGIKVPPEQLIQAYREHQPDLVGLSGLLVKSAQQMVVTAEDLRDAGIDVPILVGGAALTKRFTLLRIAPEYAGPVVYAQDAMSGLDLANKLMDPVGREGLVQTLAAERTALSAKVTPVRVAADEATPATLKSDVNPMAPVFTPPDLHRHVLGDYPVQLIRPYVNWQMLLGKHLGFRGNVEKRLAQGDDKVTSLHEMVQSLLDSADASGDLQARAVYQFFPAQADGNQILIFNPEQPTEVLETFSFPRQDKAPYLCLADFLRSRDSGVMDYVAMFTVTTGSGIRALSETWKQRGDYLKSHAIQAIALELAEAFAERVHHILRDIWGFPDAADLTMRERFVARYQGIRVSFGYPACPNLEDQAQLFRLLRPQDIGINLTEGFMMEPEASVSALVFAHPEARYFNVGEDVVTD